MDDQTKDPQYQYSMTHIGLRWIVGLIAILIPVVLFLASKYLDSVSLQPSISHYYLTPMRDLVMGSLFALAVFLCSYRGYKPEKGEWLTDRIVCFWAGFFLIIVVICPIATEVFASNNSTGIDIPSIWVIVGKAIPQVHQYSAITFITLLGILAFVNFTRAGRLGVSLPFRYRVEHGFYRLSGLTIFACVGALVAQYFIGLSKGIDGWVFFPQATFWFESAAVFAFGFSWLIKTRLLKLIFPK